MPDGFPRDVRLRRWLARDPQPDHFSGYYAEGDPRAEQGPLRVKLTNTRYKWSDAAKQLIECDKIVAHDKTGHQLRTISLGPDEDPELYNAADPDAPAASAVAIVPQGQAADLSVFLAQALPALIGSITTAITTAAREARESQSGVMNEAFKSLVGIIQAQGAVAQQTLQQNIALSQALLEEREERNQPPEQPDMNDQLAMQLLQQAGGAPSNGAAPAGFKLSPEMINMAMQYLQQQSAAPKGEG